MTTNDLATKSSPAVSGPVLARNEGMCNCCHEQHDNDFRVKQDATVYTIHPYGIGEGGMKLRLCPSCLVKLWHAIGATLQGVASLPPAERLQIDAQHLARAAADIRQEAQTLRQAAERLVVEVGAK